jgi:hypothetical protein
MEVGAGHVSRSSGLLRVEASRGRVSQFTSKLAEAQRRVVHVTLSRKLRQSQVEDGRIDTTDDVGPCYHCFSFSFYYDLGAL